MKELGYTTYYNEFNPEAKDHFVPKTIFRYKYGKDYLSRKLDIIRTKNNNW